MTDRPTPPGHRFPINNKPEHFAGRKGPWQAAGTSGTRFYPLDPHPGDFWIEDIARSLSRVCRFAGAGNAFYSVAQHSVQVSLDVPREHALAGLLHDAPEAYLGDLAGPTKELTGDYVSIEARAWVRISEQFGCTISRAVHDADQRALYREAEYLGFDVTTGDFGGVPQWRSVLLWGMGYARSEFLFAFEALSND